MTNKIRNITRIFLLTVVVLAVGYDIYAVKTGGTEASISWVVASWVYDVPAAAFAIGFVCGHLFWQMKPRKSGLDD